MSGSFCRCKIRCKATYSNGAPRRGIEKDD